MVKSISQPGGPALNSPMAVLKLSLSYVVTVPILALEVRVTGPLHDIRNQCFILL